MAHRLNLPHSNLKSRDAIPLNSIGNPEEIKCRVSGKEGHTESGSNLIYFCPEILQKVF